MPTDAPVIPAATPRNRPEPAPIFVRRLTGRDRVGRVFVYGVLIVAAALFLVPLVAMIFTSLKTMPEITAPTNTIFTPPIDPILINGKGFSMTSPSCNCEVMYVAGAMPTQ